MTFDRVNIDELAMVPDQAHGGEGLISFCRIAEAGDLEGACNFIDLAVLPPGVSIGQHRHHTSEEEFYLVLEGAGTMTRDGEEFGVRSGDLIRNAPGGQHGLVNTGAEPMRIFVFELQVTE